MSKKPWHQLHVEEMGSFTFRVESEAGHGTYAVDVLADNGKGICDCPDFQCRVAPVNSGKKARPPSVAHWIGACKHLLRARIFIGDAVIERVLKKGK